jgi:hypothetical protein
VLARIKLFLTYGSLCEDAVAIHRELLPNCIFCAAIAGYAQISSQVSPIASDPDRLSSVAIKV